MNRDSQRGIALIMALLVVAIATILAVALTTRAEIEFRRTELSLHGTQALQYVLGAEQWVAQILRRDGEESDTDHLEEAWAMQLPPLPVDGGFVTGRIEDLTGRFNLANLVGDNGQANPAAMRQFTRLLDVLGIADRVSVAAVVDWIDADSTPTPPDGAEDDHYLGLEVPYRTANRRLVATSELVMVRDVTREDLAVLEPHVAALPVRTPLNVNTAGIPVLRSLGEGISEGVAAVLVEARREEGFDSIQHFRGLLPGATDAGSPMSLGSDYFRLTVQVEIGTVNLTMYSLLERGENGRTRVIARSRTPF